MKLKKLLFSASFISTAVLAASFATSAHAQVAVYVGYGDGLRNGVDFPDPFAAGGTFVVGGTTYTISNFLGDASSGIDAGAIMLLNTGPSAVSVTDLVISNVGTANSTFQLWTGGGALQLGLLGTSLAPDTGIIFTSTANYNFDSSESSNAASSQLGFDPDTNNCSTGPIAATSLCTTTAPVVTFTIDGSTMAFNDTGHVLDTGGYDTAAYNHIHTGGGGVPEFNTNESLNWRLIGTSGVNDPGGRGVPEPATWAMMLVGFGVIGGAMRRKRPQTPNYNPA